MTFARDGYEWGRNRGFARIGYMVDQQGCTPPRYIALAIKLSDAGVGDYWEDVDQFARNHQSIMQFSREDADFFWKNAANHPAPPPDGPTDMGFCTTERVMERAIGAYAGPDKFNLYLCCDSHGAMGLFYAWDGIIRYQDGTARVNLLLNRASPWMDIDSYLPYEGKAVLRNKTAREAFVRIPLWVDRKAVHSQICVDLNLVHFNIDVKGIRKVVHRLQGGGDVKNVWFGKYLHFEGLEPDDVLTIQFPMVERTEVWMIPKCFPGWPGPDQQLHTCRFRGNTLIEVTPPLLKDIPLYQHRPEEFKSLRVPMKKVTRYVTNQRLQW
jgi:hypothetical protein